MPPETQLRRMLARTRRIRTRGTVLCGPRAPCSGTETAARTRTVGVPGRHHDVRQFVVRLFHSLLVEQVALGTSSDGPKNAPAAVGHRPA